MHWTMWQAKLSWSLEPQVTCFIILHTHCFQAPLLFPITVNNVQERKKAGSIWVK